MREDCKKSSIEEREITVVVYKFSCCKDAFSTPVKHDYMPEGLEAFRLFTETAKKSARSAILSIEGCDAKCVRNDGLSMGGHKKHKMELPIHNIEENNH